MTTGEWHQRLSRIQPSNLKRLINQGLPILKIAQNHVVTEPYVRKIAGIPNPCVSDEERRIKKNQDTINLITSEISILYEEKFITPDHTARFIESMITMTDARNILELGMYSGYTTLHMIRAIVGKNGARVTSIEPRPAHDVAFFDRPEIKAWFRWVNGWTPSILESLHGEIFDLVFIDSQHDIASTSAEVAALMPITREGSIFLFHDLPRIHPNGMFAWVESKVSDNTFKGAIFPTAPQHDVSTSFPPEVEKSQRPNLGVFVRPW